MTMEACKNESPLPGIRTTEQDFGTRYFGSGADLVRAGLVRREQLPGPTGPRKKSAVYYDGQPASRGRTYPHDEKYMQITLVGPDKFSVWVWCSTAQRESVEAQREAMRTGVFADLEDRAHAAALLERVPGSREAYKAFEIGRADSFLDCLLTGLQRTDRHGYSFDGKALQQVEAAVYQLRAAVRGGGVVFDSRRHEVVVASLRERAGLPPEQPRLRLVGGTGVVSSGD